MIAVQNAEYHIKLINGIHPTMYDIAEYLEYDTVQDYFKALEIGPASVKTRLGKKLISEGLIASV